MLVGLTYDENEAEGTFVKADDADPHIRDFTESVSLDDRLAHSDSARECVNPDDCQEVA